jgi:DNA topoisomerase-3
VVLSLTNSGALTEIPVPKGRPQERPRSASRKPTNSRTRPGSRGSAKTANGDGSSPAGEKASEKTGALGPCPLCGSDVIEQEMSYSCSGWRSGCKFAIWKTIAGKRISPRTAQALLRRGRSQVLKGFKSKAGRAFDARLKLDQGVVRFDFES